VQVHSGNSAAFDLTITDMLDAAKRHGRAGRGLHRHAAQRVVIQTEGRCSRRENWRSRRAQRRARRAAARRARVCSGGAEIWRHHHHGKAGVLLTLSSQYGANTLSVTHALERARLRRLKAEFARKGITLYRACTAPRPSSRRALANVQHSLLIGGALVGIVLLLFLLDLRTRSSRSSASRFAAHARAGAGLVRRSLNTMTLGGFAVASAWSWMTHHRRGEHPAPAARKCRARPSRVRSGAVVLDASIEVRSAVVYATFIVCVGLPAGAHDVRAAGRFFAPLGVAFILSTLASLASRSPSRRRCASCCCKTRSRTRNRRGCAVESAAPRLVLFFAAGRADGRSARWCSSAGALCCPRIWR
jgi:Cu/Ag efflux pump CusA